MASQGRTTVAQQRGAMNAHVEERTTPSTANRGDVQKTAAEQLAAGKLVADLARKGLSGNVVADAKGGGRLEITLQTERYFGFDNDTLSPKDKGALEGLAHALRRFAPRAPVRVEGHTDRIGSSEYNQDLSERRASEGAAVIRAVHGRSTIIAVGKGETATRTKDQGSADTAENIAAYAKDRRVVVSVELSAIPAGWGKGITFGPGNLPFLANEGRTTGSPIAHLQVHARNYYQRAFFGKSGRSRRREFSS